jgi:hypothetical protein
MVRASRDMLLRVTTDPQGGPPALSGPGGRPCRNCGTPLTGRFCAACGQEDLPDRLTLRDLLRESWEAVTSLEGRVLQSFAYLFFDPGFLTQEYLSGRRARWLSPMRMYLIVSVVYFGLQSLTGWGGVDFDIDVTGDNAAETEQELQSRGFESQEDLDRTAQEAVATWLPRAMFLLLPIFALLVSVVRRAAGRTYPEHLVYALHVHAAWFGAFTVTAIIGGVFGGPSLFESALDVVSIGYALWYLALSLRSVYGGTLVGSTLGGAAVGATYFMLVIGVTIAIVIPIVFVVLR